MTNVTLTQEQKHKAITVEGTLGALNFRAVTAPVFDGGGHQIQGFQRIVRTDNETTLAIMSEKYKLVEHNEAMIPAVNALGNEGWKVKASRIERGGADAFIELTRRDVAIKVVGEEVGQRILMRNSYNGSTSLTLSIGALVLVCSNGMVVPGKGSIGFHQDHTGDIREQLKFLSARISRIESAIGTRMIEAYSQLDKVVPTEIGMEIVKRVLGLRKAEKPLEYWRNGIGRDGSATAWNLYNGVTQYLTHDFQGNWGLRERKNAEALDLITGWVRSGVLPKIENPTAN